MTQIFVLNSAYGLMTAVAAIDAGLIPPTDGGRVLLTVNAALVPEATPDLREAPHLRGILSRFDHVESLNELLAPIPPTRWNPAADDQPFIERALRRAWGVRDGAIELYLQTPQIAPSRTLMEVFASASITVVGDGLMTYSPIRDRLPRTAVNRVVGVVYADVVPGVEPLVFSETGAPRIPVPIDHVRAVVDEIAAETTDAELSRLADDPATTVIVLGQYLAALGLVTEEEELRMQRRMIDKAMEFEPGRIVFKPHPSARPSAGREIAEHAHGHGLAFELYGGDLPAEVVAARLKPAGVIAGFSSALPSLRALTGVPVAAVGNDVLLSRLRPYENGNRVPVTIVDAMTRPESPYGRPEALQLLVDAVGYCMQPLIMEHLRPRAVMLLSTLSEPERARYFSRTRLRELRLPGAPGPSLASRLLTPTGGVGRGEQLRLVVRGARRRTTRAWKALQGR